MSDLCSAITFPALRAEPCSFSFDTVKDVQAVSSVLSENRAHRLSELMRQAWIPGMSVAAIVDGQLAWMEALGVTNVESGERVTEGTIFDAASLSKPLFAYIVLRLAERGEFDLDRPLHEILPYARLEHDPRYRLLTARIVLSHRTGLPNWGDEGEPLELLFNPGERFQYSGEGFVYLQKVIEAATGMSLEDLARKEVFEPLKMVNSHYDWLHGEEVKAASGHSETGHVRPKTIPHEANAAASLHTTASDYARFIMAWLHSSEGMKKAFHPVVSVSSGEPTDVESKVFWGLGIGVQKTDQGTVAFQWGDNGNFKAFLAIDPHAFSAIVYFTNSANGLAIGREVVPEVVGDMGETFDWLRYKPFSTPGWTEWHRGLAAEECGEYGEAIMHFRGALDVAATPSEKIIIQNRIALLIDLKHMKEIPLDVPERVLQQYVGRYGPIRLTLEDGKLRRHWKNELNGHDLIPLTEDTFLFQEAMERIQIFTEDGTAKKIETHRLNGEIKREWRCQS